MIRLVIMRVLMRVIVRGMTNQTIVIGRGMPVADRATSSPWSELKNNRYASYVSDVSSVTGVGSSSIVL